MAVRYYLPDEAQEILVPPETVPAKYKDTSRYKEVRIDGIIYFKYIVDPPPPARKIETA
jgi:hypothetical protein